MKKGSILVVAVSLLGMASAPRLAARKSSQDASEFSQPLLYRQVDVPEQLLGRLQRRGKEAVPFMGDVRIGDLTQDGRPDVLVFRSVDGGMKPSFLGAFTMEGKILWQVGQGGQQPNRPGPVAIHDIDGVICNGGVLWSGDGQWHRRFPNLPKPVKPVSPKEAPGWRMPWYHAIAANLAGDSREEVLLYNPWDTAIFIYTPAPLRKSAFDRYNPGPRQYNPRLMD